MRKKIDLDIFVLARLNQRLNILKQNTGCERLDMDFLLTMILDFLTDIERCSSSAMMVKTFARIMDQLGDKDKL